MYKKFKLNRTKIEGAISCQSEGGQVSLVFSVLYVVINCLGHVFNLSGNLNL